MDQDLRIWRCNWRALREKNHLIRSVKIIFVEIFKSRKSLPNLKALTFFFSSEKKEAKIILLKIQNYGEKY